MKSLHKHSVNPVATAMLAILLLGGISSAATLYGLAQPGRENDPDTGSPIHTVPNLGDTSFDPYIFHSTWSDFSHESSLEVGTFSTEVNFILNEGSISGGSEFSESWAASDPPAAIDWLLSMGNSESSREELQSLAGIWTGNLSDGKIPLEPVNADRFRNRDASLRGSRDSVPTGDLTVIPEPSSAFLGALGGLLLLRRRRAK